MPFGTPVRSQAQGAHAAVALRITAPAPDADAVVPGARARARSPSGGLRPSQVPAVQRTAQAPPGSARTQRPAGRPSASPVQPVRDVLRAAGRPLAKPVREDMEARLGADLSDVRLHDDGSGHRAAHAVGAHAFTAGSHVAFLSGQYDPASAAGRLTLAHELTHVIQQRSGPVAGTDAGGGIRVSGPADGFERAAQASARRALADGRRSPAAPARTTAGDGRPVTPTGDAVQVQRAVGFEFEVTKGNSSVQEETTNDLGTTSWRSKTDSKAALKYLDADGKLVDSGQAYVSADNGNVEYVTKPLKTRDEVISAVRSIVRFHTGKATAQGYINAEITGVDGNNYRIHVSSLAGARAQASIGVGLENIPALFARLRTLAKGEVPQPPSRDDEERMEPSTKRRKKEVVVERRSQPRRATTGERAKGGLAARVGKDAAERTEEAERLAGVVAAVMATLEHADIEDDDLEKINGFLAIIFKTALDADARKGKVLPDAKYAFTLMPRTDFISMLYSIDLDARNFVRGTLIEAIKRVASLGNKWLGEAVIGQYKGEDGSTYQGTSRRAWLESIVGGGRGGKDTLSPPPGYQPHNTPGRGNEGIGAMGTDTDGLSVFEFRGFMSGKETDSVPVGSWLDLALIVTDLVAEVTDDKQLRA